MVLILEPGREAGVPGRVEMITPTPTPGAPPMVFQTAQEAADVIVDVLDHPRAEACTSPALEEADCRCRADVPAFEAAMLTPRAGSAA